MKAREWEGLSIMHSYRKYSLVSDASGCFWVETEFLDDEVSDIDEYEEWAADAQVQVSYIGKPRIIFDNGGGITLQLPGWCHHFLDPVECAETIKAFEDEEDQYDWDGNEFDALFDPPQKQVDDGCYRIFSLEEFCPSVISEDDSWGNIVALKEALSCGK